MHKLYSAIGLYMCMHVLDTQTGNKEEIDGYIKGDISATLNMFTKCDAINSE